MADSLTNAQLDDIINLCLLAVVVGVGLVCSAVFTTRFKRQMIACGAGTLICLIACVTLVAAVIALDERQDAALVGQLEDRYGIEVGDHRFTESLGDWTIDGKTRRCAYASDDGTGQPALLCVGAALEDRYAEQDAESATAS